MLKVRGSELLIKIKGLPTIRTYPSRELPPIKQAKSIQITRHNRAIDVSIQFAFTPAQMESTGRITALDPGVSRRLTGADGFFSQFGKTRQDKRDNPPEVGLDIQRACPC